MNAGTNGIPDRSLTLTTERPMRKIGLKRMIDGCQKVETSSFYSGVVVVQRADCRTKIDVPETLVNTLKEILHSSQASLSDIDRIIESSQSLTLMRSCAPGAHVQSMLSRAAAINIKILQLLRYPELTTVRI